MTNSTNVGGRWSLMQALAWVATRDRHVVDLAGEGDPDLGHFIPGWLTIATACRGRIFTADEAWHELRSYIASGLLKADGKPALINAEPMDRKPLTIEAIDLEVVGDRDSIDRRCFLQGESASQHQWFDVEFDETSVSKAFPRLRQSTRRGGAPPKYDWPLILAHAVEQIRQYGLPGHGNRRFSTRAALERTVLDFCQHQLPAAPSEERVRTKVREWLAKMANQAAE